MKSRTSRLAITATTILFAGAALADDTTTATPTLTTGTDAGTSTTNTGTISVTGTSLPELVTETEPCAVLCYNAACLDSGCNPGDFDCVCGNPHSLVVKMGLCVGKDCDNYRQFDSGDWIADVCSAYDKSPSSSDLASASSLIVAEISSAAATATNNPVPSTGTISNGSGTTSAGAASTGTETSSAAAASSRLGGVGGVSGLFGVTSIVVGLLGGATILVAGVL
ncbi:hypothetical protein SEUCBS139899_010859 [Sporothrix eucalyptigena]|uniref:CFEM domain-containing protein n=1 Tax=Sporothrix eucalyptigena TaxID=1812306 RepID=A0ABP0BC73_9PEZI